MNRLTVAHLSAISLAPPALIEAASMAGFDGVGLRLLRVTPQSPGYPLMNDPNTMRATMAAMAETGMKVTDIEFVRLTPELDIQALLPFLDAGAALGAEHVITAPYDVDHNRLSDTLATLSDAAKDRGLKAVLEFFPWTSVPDLATCWNVVSAAGPDVGILVDTLHFDRSGSAFQLLSHIPPDRLPFAHLCDAPVEPPYSTEELLHTAREARLPPGGGQIPLDAIIDALPDNVSFGIEVPTKTPIAELNPSQWLTELRLAAGAVIARAQGTE